MWPYPPLIKVAMSNAAVPVEWLYRKRNSDLKSLSRTVFRSFQPDNLYLQQEEIDWIVTNEHNKGIPLSLWKSLEADWCVRVKRWIKSFQSTSFGGSGPALKFMEDFALQPLLLFQLAIKRAKNDFNPWILFWQIPFDCRCKPDFRDANLECVSNLVGSCVW